MANSRFSFRLPYRLATFVLTCAMLSTAPSSYAADFPGSGPIKLIVGVAAGGGTDVLARLIGQKLGENINRNVIVENRPGGNFIPAVSGTKSAEPDGHTLLVMSVSFPMTQGLRPDIPYDVVRDLTPITILATSPLVLVTRKDLPVNNLSELLALARSKPGELRYASAGHGTITHLPAALLAHSAGLSLVHVPYRGGGPSLTGLLGGQVDLMFDPTQTIVPQIQSGTVKPIAVSTPSRTPELPDVPTIAEAGLPGFDVQSWVGVVGPPNMPKAVLDSVHKELVRALRSPEVSNRLRELANQPVGNSPEEFTEYLKSEVARWSKLIKDAKITPPE